MAGDIDLNPGTTTFATQSKLRDVQQVEILRGPQGTLFGAGFLERRRALHREQPDLDKFRDPWRSRVTPIMAEIGRCHRRAQCTV